MAAIRVSRVEARSNQTANMRISEVRVQQGDPPLVSSMRVSSVLVQNLPGGDAWVMSAGVWVSVHAHVRTNGVWV